MTDLNDTLKEIASKAMGSGMLKAWDKSLPRVDKPLTPDEIVELIHNAFQEAGYSCTEIYDDGQHQGAVMTGRDWYERFTKELEKTEVNHSYNPRLVFNSTVVAYNKAAKRASGIINE